MNLLSTQTIATATGILNDLFDTHSRLITIFKEPIKIINSSVNSSPPPMYGYGDASTPLQDITYQPVSGIFPAVVLYSYKTKDRSMSIAEQTKTKLELGENYIKVRTDASNFIEQGGRVESILIDGKTWNIGTIRDVQHFLGLKYFYYSLQPTD